MEVARVDQVLRSRILTPAKLRPAGLLVRKASAGGAEAVSTGVERLLRGEVFAQPPAEIRSASATPSRPVLTEQLRQR
jgi:hypothetical protein